MDPTELYKAAAKGDLAVFDRITSNKDLEEPWDIPKPITDEIDSILHVATKFQQEKFAEKLIDMNESLVVLKNKEEDTPLHIAARDTALHDAVRNGHQSVVELLLSEKPTLAMIMNEAGESPLFLAVDRNNYDIADYILQNAPELP
ncbi:hypothetical protein I3760_07G069000 [Carya illinoinensis]|nr:hypothetical protein I3760_07G069000 [Carya illinoinensis]